MRTPDPLLLVRPKTSLLRYGFITFAVTTVPLFSVLYLYTAPAGTWWHMASIHLLIAGLCMLAYWRQRNVYSAVTSDQVEGNGIFSAIDVVPLAEVSRVVLAKVFAPHSLDTTTQLVVLDASGTCRFRMRGQFWHLTDLTAFANATGAEVVNEAVALGEREFFEKYPGSRYWFEGNPFLRLSFVVASVITVVIVAAWLMTVIGSR